MTTITEALAEIKTIQKRIVKKQDAISQYLVRDVRLKDPLASQGGAVTFIAQERQAVGDLRKRVVAIRTAIQRKNLEASLTVQGVTQTVTEWLVWRRECAKDEGGFMSAMLRGIAEVRTKLAKEGRKMVSAEVEAGDTDVVISLDEKDLHAAAEKHEQILGELDGKLSLLNATTTLEI